jgi:uncharacterized membrane protein
MKSQRVVFTLVVLSLIIAASVLAYADCPHDTATVKSLRDCVTHAAAEGHIDTAGITKSLLAKLDAAQAAVDRDQRSVAINHLEAFIHEVQAQAGKHIDAEHAGHLVEHANRVLQALSE